MLTRGGDELLTNKISIYLSIFISLGLDNNDNKWSPWSSLKLKPKLRILMIIALTHACLSFVRGITWVGSFYCVLCTF